MLKLCGAKLVEVDAYHIQILEIILEYQKEFQRK